LVDNTFKNLALQVFSEKLEVQKATKGGNEKDSNLH